MSGSDVTLTITEWDTIDNAKRRIKAFTAAIDAVAALDADDQGLLDSDDHNLCISELTRVMWDDINAIDEALKSADKRQKQAGRG